MTEWTGETEGGLPFLVFLIFFFTLMTLMLLNLWLVGAHVDLIVYMRTPSICKECNREFQILSGERMP